MVRVWVSPDVASDLLTERASKEVRKTILQLKECGESRQHETGDVLHLGSVDAFRWKKPVADNGHCNRLNLGDEYNARLVFTWDEDTLVVLQTMMRDEQYDIPEVKRRLRAYHKSKQAK